MLRLHLPTGAVRFICQRLTVQVFHASKVAGGLRRVCLHYTAITRFLLRAFKDGPVQSHRETMWRS